MSKDLKLKLFSQKGLFLIIIFIFSVIWFNNITTYFREYLELNRWEGLVLSISGTVIWKLYTIIFKIN